MSSYKHKQINVYFEEKEKLFHTLECQLINAKVMIELENHHLSNIIVIIDSCKNQHEKLARKN